MICFRTCPPFIHRFDGSVTSHQPSKACGRTRSGLINVANNPSALTFQVETYRKS